MSSKLVPAIFIIAVVSLTTAGVIFAVRRTGDSTRVSGGGDFPVLASIADLKRSSDVVVIVTVKADKDTRKIPQGDPNRGPDPGKLSVLREFELSAETYLKGDKGPSPVVSISIGMEEPRRGETLWNDREAQPLQIGARYVLFLREARAPTYVGLASTAEPWRFRLENGRAQVISPVNIPPGQFPTTETELLRAIATAQ